jgi:hypothetical protein
MGALILMIFELQTLNIRAITNYKNSTGGSYSPEDRPNDFVST